MRQVGVTLAVFAIVFAVWFFAVRPAMACWERGGSPVRGFFDNVECVERR